MVPYHIRKSIGILAGISLLLIFFQNCAEDVDTSLYQSHSLSSLGPVISKQSAPIVNVNENNNANLFIEVSNLSSYQIEWYKNGALIAGENNLSLSFTPATLSDAGTYHAIVRYDTNLSLQSANIALTVNADPNPRSYTNLNVTFNNLNYTVYFVSSAIGFSQANLDAFCKYKIGNSTATYTSYTLGGSTTITRYAYAANQADCSANTLSVGYTSGLCLSFYSPGFTVTSVANVTCKP